MPTGKELLRFLREHGYEEVRQRGSHLILKHPTRRMFIFTLCIEGIFRADCSFAS